MASDITSIEQLISHFNEAAPTEQASILKRISIPTSEFEDFATWCEDGYTRNCIARRDGFEFILLCWSPGAVTPMHDHAGQHCWVYQVDGSIHEKRFTRNDDDSFKKCNEMTLNAGKISYMHDRMGYHLLQNDSNERSMTLHVYANPIDRCQVFNEEKACFEMVEMQYDTIDGAVVLSTGS